MTRARWTILVASLVIVLAVAVVYRQSLVLRIASMRPFVEDRFDGWVQAGADEAELDAAFRRVHDPIGTGPGSWVYEVYLVSESGIAQEEWVYEGDGHCASGHAREHVPKAAAWIKRQLNRIGPS